MPKKSCTLTDVSCAVLRIKVSSCFLFTFFWAFFPFHFHDCKTHLLSQVLQDVFNFTPRTSQQKDGERALNQCCHVEIGKQTKIVWKQHQQGRVFLHISELFQRSRVLIYRKQKKGLKNNFFYNMAKKLKKREVGNFPCRQ